MVLFASWNLGLSAVVVLVSPTNAQFGFGFPKTGQPKPTSAPKGSRGGGVPGGFFGFLPKPNGGSAPKSGGGGADPFAGFLPKPKGGDGGGFPFGGRGGNPGFDSTESSKALWQPKVQATFQIVLSGILDMLPVKPAMTNATINSTISWNSTAHTNASIPHATALKDEPFLTPGDVEIFDFDVWENKKETIDQLHKMGKKVICYFSAGTSEDWRPDFKEFKDSDLGAKLPMWRGERWLDIREQTVWTIMQKRIKLASTRGCDAVDPDNVDGYDNEKGGGFKKPLTKRDAITYVRKLAREAKKYGMSTGLKNAASILRSVEDDMQFAVNEECAQLAECDVYKTFVQPSRGNPGKPVFHIEYVKLKPTPHRSTSGVTVPGAPGSGFEISSAVWPSASAQTVREKMCLHGKDLGTKMSTVIKEFNLNGWVMYCDGTVHTTRTAPGNTGPGPVQVRTRRFHQHAPGVEYEFPNNREEESVNTYDSDIMETILNPKLELDNDVWEADVGHIDEEFSDDEYTARGAGKDRIGPDGPITIRNVRGPISS